MIKYQSITTPSIKHDVYNILTEFVYLNKFGNTGEFPWREKGKEFWSNTISVLKKLMSKYEISPDQMAFYIYKCRPKDLSGSEFAQATVVPKILFKRLKLTELVEHYKQSHNLKIDSVMIQASYKRPSQENRPKTLLELMKELENEKTDTGRKSV